MLRRIPSTSGILDSIYKKLTAAVIYLISILILVGGFTRPARGTQNQSIDSAYASRLDSILSISGLKIPDMVSAAMISRIHYE